MIGSTTGPAAANHLPAVGQMVDAQHQFAPRGKEAVIDGRREQAAGSGIAVHTAPLPAPREMQVGRIDCGNPAESVLQLGDSLGQLLELLTILAGRSGRAAAGGGLLGGGGASSAATAPPAAASVPRAGVGSAEVAAGTEGRHAEREARTAPPPPSFARELAYSLSDWAKHAGRELSIQQISAAIRAAWAAIEGEG